MVAGLYALVLLCSPVLHDDLASHLKSPGHCAVCMATPQASQIETSLAAAELRLPRAGRVEMLVPTAPDIAVLLASSGRSPPA